MNQIMFVVPPTRSYTQRMPLGVMCISAYLQKQREDSEILDYKGITSKEAFQKIKHRLLEEQPKVVGITCMVSEVGITKDICDFIKANLKETVVVIGGSHPTICTQHLCQVTIITKNIHFTYSNQ